MLLSTLLFVGGTLRAQQFSKTEEIRTTTLLAKYRTITRDIARSILRTGLDTTPYAHIRARQLLRITSVCASAGRSKEIRFNKIYIAGNSRYKVLKRQHDLYNNDALGKEVYPRPKGSVYT